MKNEYEVGVNGRGKPFILIRRKPSEVPTRVDMTLTRIAGHCLMDGPNNMMTYEFLLPEKIKDAEEFMQSIKWEKVEKQVEKTFSITDQYGGHGPSILIPAYIGVSDEIREKFNKLSAWGGNTANSNDYLLWEFPINRDVDFVEAYNILKDAGYKRTGSLFGEVVCNEAGRL